MLPLFEASSPGLRGGGGGVAALGGGGGPSANLRFVVVELLPSALAGGIGVSGCP